MKKKVARENAVGGSVNPGAEMSLVGHIIELRKHIVRSLLWFLFFVIISMSFMEHVVAFLRRPYEMYQKSIGKSPQLMSIGLFEVVMMNFKICLIVGLVASAPFMIRELWRFVSPALYENERKIALPVVVSSVFLFFAGISFGFFVIVPVFLSNTLEWASQYASVILTVENYFSSLTTMVMIFGIIFEVPVVMSLLGLAGLLKSETLAKNRRVVLLGSFILGAVISPPDVFSQTVVSVPLYLMIELSVYALRYIERRRARDLAREEALAAAEAAAEAAAATQAAATRAALTAEENSTAQLSAHDDDTKL